MKNQYYGDINDYKKYAYLRHLVTGGDFTLGINWYLTQDDGGPDGNKTAYLDLPEVWRNFDEELFDNLHQSVIIDENRTVENAPLDLGLGEEVAFFTEITPDFLHQRGDWLNQGADALHNCNLVFLDPDNGLSVPSTPMGQLGCSKYSYDNEVQIFSEGATENSLVIYQHFPRKEREEFMNNCSQRVSALLNRNSIFRVRTSNVLFLVIPSTREIDSIRNLTFEFGTNWEQYITVSEWQANN